MYGSDGFMASADVRNLQMLEMTSRSRLYCVASEDQIKVAVAQRARKVVEGMVAVGYLFRE